MAAKRGKPKRIGIRDVAEATGLSITTVSHALSGKGQIAPDTRDRVRAAAERLGYRPDPVARGLVSGRTGILGLAVSHMAEGPWEGTYRPYYAAFSAGATMAAIERDYALVVLPGDPASGLWSRVPVDGLIIVDPVREDPLLLDCARRGLPVVTDGRPIDPGYDTVPTVESDLATGMRAILDHLWDSGGRSIALLSGAEADSYTMDCEDLYRRWCAERGTTARIEAPARDEEPAAAARRLLDSPTRPDAVHGLNETYGQALLVAARRLTLDIPGDVRLSVMSETAAPKDWDIPLTVLSLDAKRIGAEAASLLIDTLAGTSRRNPVVPCTVVPRDSTFAG
ncbi:LacI family DNA-binding transcriptional regulator [Yinghuangia seranimata]|uniref:LacI family DNA-binding transcriptional regulator n=1 Tax=Yinghuangia seranimata TaxID=408067 RepID=UPI00248A9A67|nr:LacI family DNA-binding transcriptional regulator [Yinghuangia seranimata]MDI2125310.1 LacI family DNA-binding transcriptional regulator [Yinghuangia seranimata]